MKEEMEFRWLNSEDTKNPLKILGLNKTTKDKILLLENNEKEFVRCSIWGKNWNFLVFNYPDSDLWVGKSIIMKEEQINDKNIRTITKIL